MPQLVKDDPMMGRAMREKMQAVLDREMAERNRPFSVFPNNHETIRTWPLATDCFRYNGMGGAIGLDWTLLYSKFQLYKTEYSPEILDGLSIIVSELIKK